MDEGKTDSVLRIVEENQELAMLAIKTLLELVKEVKNPRPNEETPLESLVNELNDYVQVRCDSCSIRKRLEKIENDD